MKTQNLTEKLKERPRCLSFSFPLKKLRSYKFFQKVINFLDILDCIAPVSLVFEGKGGIFEVAYVIAKLEVNLNYFECS